MGVVNMTPDSFSGKGLAGDATRGVALGLEMHQLGADLIDVGGESTRPGFTPVDECEEIGRVSDTIQGLAEAGVRVSVDTRKARVAEAGLLSGAIMVNDVSCLADPQLAWVAADSHAWLVISHSAHPGAERGDIDAIVDDLRGAIDRAVAMGMPAGRLIVDPGLGFGKSWRANLRVVRDLSRIRTLGVPVLVGPSRKATVSRVLGVEPHDRLEGTLALVGACIANGADLVRVHDVRQCAPFVRMMDALTREPRMPGEPLNYAIASSARASSLGVQSASRKVMP